MTFAQLLSEGTDTLLAAGSTDAAPDARELLLAAFDMDLTHFLLDRGRPAEETAAGREAVCRYRGMIARRAARCPLQQILGRQEFMGLEFYVNEHVLIPRQDTETLVELVLAEQSGRGRSVLDLCTGSGCIAVSLAVKGSFSRVAATDISAEALAVARANARALAGDREITFYEGDLFAALGRDGSAGTPSGADTEDGPSGADADGSPSGASAGEASPRFDVIVSNPPYIPTAVIGTLEPEVREHEPLLALDGSADGLCFYRRIAAEAKRYLNPGGALYLEIGYDQGAAVSGLLETEGFCGVRVVKDLPGNDRVVCAVTG